MVAAALALGIVLRHYLGVSNVALVFLTAVLASAVTYGLWPSLVACLVAVLAYNFFFLPPLYTFTIADRENVVALIVFAIVAVVASNLTARIRAEALAAQRRAKTTEELFMFSRKLASVVSLDDLLWAIAYQISSMLKLHVVLLLPENGTVAVRSGYPPEDLLNDADLAAAKWSWSSNQPAGRGADTLPGAKRLFLPMRTGRGPVAVVGLDTEQPGPLLTPEQRTLLDALMDQAALAIERVNLAADVDRARLQPGNRAFAFGAPDVDLPRSAHAAGGDPGRGLEPAGCSASTLDAAAKDELVATIQEEAERLNRFIGNLLDMTRLESGAIVPHAEPVDLARYHRQRAAARGEGPRSTSGRGRSGCQPADAEARRRAVRAGAIQPPRQRRQIHAARNLRSRLRARREDDAVRIEMRRRRAGHSARRSRTHLRQILPRARRRRETRGHRPRPRHLPRLRRSDGRHARGRQPARRQQERCSPSPLPALRHSRGKRRSHERTPAPVLVVDDEPAIRRLLRTALGRQVIASRKPRTARRRSSAMSQEAGGYHRARSWPSRHRRFRRPERLRAKGSRCRSSCCRAAPTRAARCTRSTWAPTITSASRSASRNCWPACARRCAIAPAARASSRCSERRSHRRPGPAHRHGAGPGGEAHAARIRHPAAACRPRGQGADAQFIQHEVWGGETEVQYLRSTCARCARSWKPTPTAAARS